MSILTTDLAWYYSNPQASGGNQLSQNNPANSLGGQLSATVWAGMALNDLFDDVSGAANAEETSEYRCVFIVNKNTSFTWTAPSLWFGSLPALSNIAVGLDPTAASAVHATGRQAVTVNSTLTPPAGVTFSTPTSESPLSLGSIPPGSCKAVWFRRTGANSAASGDTPDDAALDWQGDSA